jgi:hypothetical protein
MVEDPERGESRVCLVSRAWRSFAKRSAGIKELVVVSGRCSLGIDGYLDMSG